MECYIYQDASTGKQKVWCIDISSSTSVTVYFGALNAKLQYKVIASKYPRNEARKRANGKVKKGYSSIDGYVDDNNMFIRGSKPEDKVEPAPKPKDDFKLDLSKVKQKSGLWF